MLPVKGFDVLLRATAELLGQLPNLHVLIAGDGPELDALTELASDLGLRDAVRLLGRRSDIPDVLAALDLAVCSSRSEGSPLSVMEYMRAGLPVVASDVGGIPDLIEPGVNGLLVAPNDPKSLAAAIADILDDPQQAAKMGEISRVRRFARNSTLPSSRVGWKGSTKSCCTGDEQRQRHRVAPGS